MDIKSLMNNPYAWVILSVCTILSFVFGIYTWVAGKRKKEFSYVSNSHKIIEKGKSRIPQLELKYEGRDIDNLTITNYVIWNTGNEVINFSDIVAEKELEIYSCNKADTIVLDARIIEETEETNKFEIMQHKDEFLKIGFDYADPQDGIVVQVLHTGSAADLDIGCKIKGGKQIKKLNRKIYTIKLGKMKIYAVIFETIACTVMLIFEWLLAWNIIPVFEVNLIIYVNENIANKMAAIIATVLYVIAMGVLYNEMRRTYHMNIPKKLRESMDDNGLEK